MPADSDSGPCYSNDVCFNSPGWGEGAEGSGFGLAIGTVFFLILLGWGRFFSYSAISGAGVRGGHAERCLVILVILIVGLGLGVAGQGARGQADLGLSLGTVFFLIPISGAGLRGREGQGEGAGPGRRADLWFATVFLIFVATEGGRGVFCILLAGRGQGERWLLSRCFFSFSWLGAVLFLILPAGRASRGGMGSGAVCLVILIVVLVIGTAFFLVLPAREGGQKNKHQMRRTTMTPGHEAAPLQTTSSLTFFYSCPCILIVFEFLQSLGERSPHDARVISVICIRPKRAMPMHPGQNVMETGPTKVTFEATSWLEPPFSNSVAVHLGMSRSLLYRQFLAQPSV